MKHLRQFRDLENRLEELPFSFNPYDDEVIDPQDISEIRDILKDIEDDMDIQVTNYGKSFLELIMPSTHFRTKEKLPVYVVTFTYKQEHVQSGVVGISYFLKDDVKDYMMNYIKRCIMGRDIIGLVSDHFVVRRFTHIGSHGKTNTYFNTIMFCTSKIAPYIKEFDIIKSD